MDTYKRIIQSTLANLVEGQFAWFRIDLGMMQYVVPVLHLGEDYITVLFGRRIRHIRLDGILTLEQDDGNQGLTRTTKQADLDFYVDKQKEALVHAA